MIRNVFCRLSLASLLTVIPLYGHVNAQQGRHFHLLKSYKVGGEGGWDYLTIDPESRRLFVSRSTHVMVIDAESGAVVGDIPNTPGVHGIALVPKLGKGFTSNGRDNSVTVFDLKDLKPQKMIKVGQNPDAIIYDPASERVFAFNGRSQDATAIDARTDSVAGTVSLGGKPEFAAADGKGRVFVNLEDKSEVVAFDSRKLSVLAHWSLKPGEEPSGMAMDRDSGRLFISCANKMMVVMSAADGRIITTLPTGAGTDAAAFDPQRKVAFSSNGEGTLTVIHEDSPDKFQVLENVPSQKSARTLTIDDKRHLIYLVAAQFGDAPAATTQQPRPRPAMIPGTFTVLIFGESD
jgi:DNA-binding beta-propeller fold protein YncE